MYLSGGYTSFLYPFTSECGDFGCGDTDASAYRYYLNDVWSSPDGLNWKQLTKAAFTFSVGGASHSFPRGGHTMIVFNPPPSYPITFASPCKKGGNDACAFAQSDGRGYPELWVFGGRGGENELHKLSPKTPVEDVDYYYNDIWVSRAQESSGDKTLGTSGTWFRLRQNSDPSVPDDGTFPLGRTGHTATLTCTWPRTDCLISLPEGLMASPEQRFIFIVGGQGLNPNPTPPQKLEWGHRLQPLGVLASSTMMFGLGDQMCPGKTFSWISRPEPFSALGQTQRFNSLTTRPRSLMSRRALPLVN
jgi:hypothetical protein